MSEMSLSESCFVEMEGGIKVHYKECGQGSVILFVHGSGPGASGQSNFEANMKFFAAQGFRAVALDLFGYGWSSKPDDVEYSVAFQVSAVKAVVQALGVDGIYLVGNSLGGAVSMRFTMENPAKVKRLVLLAPGGLGHKLRYARMPGIRAMMWSMIGPGGPTYDKLKKVFGRQLYDSSKVPDAVIQERLSVALTQPKAVFAKMKIEDLTPRLGEISCPTLVFWGVDDQFCPVETAPKLTAGIKGAKTLLVGQCGHWVHVEHPEYFNEECLSFFSKSGEK